MNPLRVSKWSKRIWTSGNAYPVVSRTPPTRVWNACWVELVAAESEVRCSCTEGRRFLPTLRCSLPLTVARARASVLCERTIACRFTGAGRRSSVPWGWSSVVIVLLANDEAHSNQSYARGSIRKSDSTRGRASFPKSEARRGRTFARASINKVWSPQSFPSQSTREARKSVREASSPTSEASNAQTSARKSIREARSPTSDRREEKTNARKSIREARSPTSEARNPQSNARKSLNESRNAPSKAEGRAPPSPKRE